MKVKIFFNINGKRVPVAIRPSSGSNLKQRRSIFPGPKLCSCAIALLAPLYFPLLKEMKYARNKAHLALLSSSNFGRGLLDGLSLVGERSSMIRVFSL